MNDQRRKAIEEIIEQISVIRDDLETHKEDEEEYRDNIPENLQGSTRFEKADEAANNLQEALDSIDSGIESMQSAIEKE